MLLQRKYDSRLASSKSPITGSAVVIGGLGGGGLTAAESSSTRKRNSGETSTAWTASWMPRSKRSPCGERQLDELDELRQLAWGDRPAVGPAREPFEDRAGRPGRIGLGLGSREHDPPVRLGQRISGGVQRPFDLDRLDDQVAVALLGVGGVRLVVVVQERDREPPRSHRATSGETDSPGTCPRGP